MSRAVGVRYRLRVAAFAAQLRPPRLALYGKQYRSNPVDEWHLCVRADERSLWIKIFGGLLPDRLPLLTASATILCRLESVRVFFVSPGCSNLLSAPGTGARSISRQVPVSRLRSGRRRARKTDVDRPRVGACKQRHSNALGCIVNIKGHGWLFEMNH